MRQNKMSAQVILFACSKCFSRHPFEELSPGQQLCKVGIHFIFSHSSFHRIIYSELNCGPFQHICGDKTYGQFRYFQYNGLSHFIGFKINCTIIDVMTRHTYGHIVFLSFSPFFSMLIQFGECVCPHWWIKCDL